MYPWRRLLSGICINNSQKKSLIYYLDFQAVMVQLVFKLA
jgi:hypothetical protein